jgi:hypothetical protein
MSLKTGFTMGNGEKADTKVKVGYTIWTVRATGVILSVA